MAILQEIYISRQLQEDFVEAKFYCPHTLADSTFGLRRRC